MIVEQAEIDRILNPKIRQRTLQLPVKRGRQHGELKRCPMRKGGMYSLQPPIPYGRYRQIGERQPTRARAILRLWDLCDRHQARSVKVTVMLDPERQGDEWIVYFELGDHRASHDRPFFLAKSGDYTMSASKQAVPGDPEVLMPLAADLAKARAKALERRITPQQQQLNRAILEAETLRQAMTSMKARNRLALILKEMEKVASELSVDASATLPESVCAARQASAKVEGEPRPSGTEPLVSLESAA